MRRQHRPQPAFEAAAQKLPPAFGSENRERAAVYQQRRTRLLQRTPGRVGARVVIGIEPGTDHACLGMPFASTREIACMKLLPRAHHERGACRAHDLDRLRRADDLGVPRPHTLARHRSECGGSWIALAPGDDRELAARVLVRIGAKLRHRSAELRIRVFPNQHRLPFSPSARRSKPSRPPATMRRQVFSLSRACIVFQHDSNAFATRFRSDPAAFQQLKTHLK